MESLATFFKSLGDESRIRIVNILCHFKTLAVRDFEHILNLSQTNVSRHLTVLRNAGVVQPRRSGNFRIYGLSGEVTPEFKHVFLQMAEGYVQLKLDVRKAEEYLGIKSGV